MLKGAWARATYDLKRDPDLSSDSRAELILHNVKLNDARRLVPYEFAVVSEGDRGPIRFEASRTTSPQLLASLPLAERMWRVLAGAGHSMSPKDLAEELDTTQGTIRDLLSRDQKRGAERRFVRLPDNSVALLQRGAGDA